MSKILVLSLVLLTLLAAFTEKAAAENCDLNGDGQLNVLDIQIAVNCILGGGCSADVNGDGRTDVLDVQTLVNVVLGIASCPGTNTTSTLTTSTSTTSSTETTIPTTSTITTTTESTTTTTSTTTSTTTTTTSTTTTHPITTTTTTTTTSTTRTTTTTTTSTSTSTTRTTTTTTTSTSTSTTRTTTTTTTSTSTSTSTSTTRTTTTTTTSTSTSTTTTSSTTTTLPVLRIEVQDMTSRVRVNFAVLNNTPGSFIQLHVAILDALNRPVVRAFSTALVADPQASGSPVNIRRLGTEQNVLEITPGDDCLNACSATILVDTPGAATAKVVISVEGISVGGPGGNINDPEIDDAGRVYMAFSDNHTILRAESVSGAATVFAGTPGTSGPQDGPRLSARFNGPSFLSIDRSNSRLYISDSINRAIRLLQLTGEERVSTLPTGGVFSNPQGVALDGKNRLWVVDSGNHTIQLIDLNAAPVRVKRIAGSPGLAGDQSGTGDTARFRTPVGIAIEKDYPPIINLPVRVLVVDRGNGKIKRILDTGEVTTVATLDSSALAAEGVPVVPPPGEAATLTGVGIAVDPVGNVFVGDQRGVWAVVPGKGMIPVSQSASIQGANGLIVPDVGRLIVSADRISITTYKALADHAESKLNATKLVPAFSAEEQSATVFGVAEVSFPAPRIDSVSPQQISNRGGERVTIRGANLLPGSQVLIASAIVDPDLVVIPDTTSVVLTSPRLSFSGPATVGVMTCGGIAEAPLLFQGTQTPEIVAQGDLESPTPGQTVAGTLSGSGWAFLLSGKIGSLPSRVEIWIDERFAALAESGIYRIDIQNMYERQGIIAPVRSGFQFTVNNGLLAPGKHTLSVRAYNPFSVGPAFFEIGRISFTLVSNPCGYSISPLGRTHGSKNETGSFGISAYKGCRWTAASNAGWINITSGSSGDGEGTVNYVLTSNSKTSQRVGTITVSGQSYSQIYTITQRGTTVLLCNLFGDDFNDGNASGWATSGGTWQAIQGKLQIGGVMGTAMARHTLRLSSYFRLSADIEYVDLNGILGFYSSSISQTYVFDPGTGVSYTINGMGAAVSASGKVSFLFYDMKAQVFRTVDVGNFGPVTNLGITWLNSGIMLAVNGTIRGSLAASNFGLRTLPTPVMDSVSLIATGEGTLASFDNVCEGQVIIMGLPDGAGGRDVLPMYRGMSALAKALDFLRAHSVPPIP